MSTEGGCPPAVVATSAAAARSLRLPPPGFHPPQPRRRAAAIKGAHCLPFRSPFAKGPWEGVRLCSSRGGSSLAPSRGRDGRAPRRLWARCTAAPLCGGSLLWWRDAGAAALVMGGAYSLVLCFDVLTQRDLIDPCNDEGCMSSSRCRNIEEGKLKVDVSDPPGIHLIVKRGGQKLSRKIVHVLSGILFMSSWPIFSSSIEARFFAALAPFVNCLRLTVYGLSLVTDEGLIKSVTREGKPEELLRGPLYYVLVLMFCVLVFWRDSPVGVTALAMMSGGDGIADIMGRKFGAARLPYNNRKSWVGSICMFTFGFFVSMGMLYYFASLGYFDLDGLESAKKVALISLTATLVESLPFTDVLDDNISVPLSSMLMGSLLFG
ncbi:hypothetical protein Taro_022115 [Colocasia esculenta]|uniref:phytol kinase n=1 Tax=Colocasia esculenta TaxID=4460 RepID=A0A843V0M7_COLES|nr:hypothetical protein [Colocasia esculenta]